MGKLKNLLIDAEDTRTQLQALDDMVEYETPSTWEKMWDGFIDFMTLVGMVATVCFIAGYVIVNQPSSVVQCEPTKTVLARSIFK
jgi:hypothetical protein